MTAKKQKPKRKSGLSKDTFAGEFAQADVHTILDILEMDAPYTQKIAAIRCYLNRRFEEIKRLDLI